MVNDALRQNGEVHEYIFVGVGYICSRSYYGKDGVHLNSTDALQRSCGNWTFDGAARGVVARDTGLSCCFPNAPPRATYNKRHMQSSLRLIYLITIETNPGPKPVVCPICMRSINDRKEIRRPLNTGIFSALSKKSRGAEIRNHYLIHGQMRPTNWAVVPQIVTNRKRLMKIWQNLQKKRNTDYHFSALHNEMWVRETTSVWRIYGGWVHWNCTKLEIAKKRHADFLRTFSTTVWRKPHVRAD